LKFVLLALLTLIGSITAPAQRPLTLEDLMTWNHIEDVTISDNGAWVAYATTKDRGDGEGVVRAVENGKLYRIPRGTEPVLGAKGGWAAMTQIPPLAEKLAAEKDEKKDALADNMVLINLGSGKTETFERVASFAFSEDELWVAWLHLPDKDEEAKKGEEAEDGEKKKKKEKLGSRLVLRRLQTGDSYQIDYVTRFAFDPLGRSFVYAVEAPDGEGNGLFLRYLGGDADAGDPTTVMTEQHATIADIAWADDGGWLAWLEGVRDAEKGEKQTVAYTLAMWQPEKNRNHRAEDIPAGWMIPENSKLSWTEDGKRLFFGLRPVGDEEPADLGDEKDEAVDLYDIGALRDDRELDIWHGDDPKIKPHERHDYKQDSKKTYTATLTARSLDVVALADETMPDLTRRDPRASAAVGSSQVPYMREMTWYGSLRDLYHVDLDNGKRTLIEERNDFGRYARVAPNGRHVAYYRDGDLILFDSRRETKTNLTAGIEGISFDDEDDDRPQPDRPHGIAGWLSDSSAVLVYDKFDIWYIPVKGRDEPYRVTGGEGRENNRVFRIVDLDDDHEWLEPGQTLLLRAYSHTTKDFAFYQAEVGKDFVAPRLEGPKKYDFVVKAEDADVIVYTRQAYDEPPDLWAADSALNNPARVSTENPQIRDLAWGEAELVSWRSQDGIPLDGVLIKPAGYEEGKRYPVLVYFYRFYSQRLREFNEMRVNHRPNFPFFASHGYAVFLPDVRFEIGEPGMSAVRCLVPGVQKLIDMGVADPDAVGLHGHSWSGYQSAFMVTKTDMFACVVSGAPVSNMTSAYGGIRLGSGRARQFQYEQTQSRLRGSLWEARADYIDNSPLFFADRINTPMLIMFGDEDTAVPWHQGVELYLAMRRHDKDVVFLQYHGEPHHLKKYANKVDYTLRMKAYLDHYCKGEPAPDWITKGEPFDGK